MTIYVDPIRNWGKRGDWCHMACDGDIEELHTFARRIGLQRSWFQAKNPRHLHYDLRPSKRVLAIKAGAVEVSSAELLQRCTRRHDIAVLSAAYDATCGGAGGMNQYILVSQPRLIGTGYRHRVAFDCRAAADAFAEQMGMLRPGRKYWIEDADEERDCVGVEHAEEAQTR